MTDLSCKNCIYWEKFDIHDYGICRRYAPQPLTNKHINYGDPGCERYPAVSWPVTSASDWCSEGKEPKYGSVNL